MNHHVHYTEAHRYMGHDGHGWEYICSQCGYRARYLLPERGVEGRLLIVTPGNKSARHIDRPSVGGRLARPVHTMDAPVAEDEGLTYEEQAVLPSHLEKQIVEIIQRADQSQAGY